MVVSVNFIHYIDLDDIYFPEKEIQNQVSVKRKEFCFFIGFVDLGKNIKSQMFFSIM